jgi:hypothetical protein
MAPLDDEGGALIGREWPISYRYRHAGSIPELTPPGPAE